MAIGRATGPIRRLDTGVVPNNGSSGEFAAVINPAQTATITLEPGQQGVTVDSLFLGSAATLTVDGGASLDALNVGGPIVNLGGLDAGDGAALLVGAATFQAGAGCLRQCRGERRDDCAG